MKKTTSKALASAALTALIAGIIPVGQVSAATNTEFQRLSGKDRYLTAVEVSKAGWAEGADYAIVANGEAYADALSAGPFAKKNNAPILLTSSKGITNETVNELKRLKVKKVYVIGETGVVPNSILETIKKNVTTDVERIGGSDRYATSTKIAEKFGTVNEAMLASGEGYADALSAVPAAAVKGIPVLLTKAGELPKATSDYIKAQGLKRTFVVGGTASVSDKVKGLVPDSVRLGGKNRFETNAEIIKSFALDFNFDKAYFALANGTTGKEFADALTASALAAKGGHPVIISNKAADVATTAIINEKLSPTTKIIAIGGAPNLSDSLMKSYQIKGETIEAAKDITGNVVVSKDNVELKDMKVTGNLYLEGNNAELNNVTVDGTVFVNPGKEGSAKLNNVTADKIVVLSGSNESVHLNNVTCNTLYVSSKTQTKIVLEGTANIKNVEIFSSAIIDAKNEFKGTVVVLDNLYVNDIELLGEYSGTITVKDKSDNVKLPGGSGTPGGGGGGGGTIDYEKMFDTLVSNVTGKVNGNIETYATATFDKATNVIDVQTVAGKEGTSLIQLVTNLRTHDTKELASKLETLVSTISNMKVNDKNYLDYIIGKLEKTNPNVSKQLQNIKTAKTEAEKDAAYEALAISFKNNTDDELADLVLSLLINDNATLKVKVLGVEVEKVTLAKGANNTLVYNGESIKLTDIKSVLGLGNGQRIRQTTLGNLIGATIELDLGHNVHYTINIK